MSHAAGEFISGRAGSGKGGIDWKARRRTYLDALNALYGKIEEFLAEPLKQGKAKLRREKREITENYLGTYSVDDLVLEVGSEHVRFVPRGRNIVGAAGRVDVLGDGGDATLVVQPGDNGGRWGVVATRQPTLKIISFDDASFAELLKAVMAPLSRANPVHVRSPAQVDDWHDGMVESLVRHRAVVREAAVSGANPGLRFALMNEREVDDHFLTQRANLDRLTVVDLVSAGEAAVRMDYDRRLLRKLKDPLSEAYRKFHRKLKNQSKDRPPFDRQGILELLSAHVGTSAARAVGEYRACLMARHWVAHGRYGDAPQGLALTVFETRRRVEALLNALPA